MNKKIYSLLFTLIALSMLISACGTPLIPIPGMVSNDQYPAATVDAPEPPSQTAIDAACVGHDGKMITVEGFNVTCPESKETAPVATEPPAEEVPAKAEKQVFLYTPFTTAVPLIDNDLMIGVRFDLTDDKPYRIVTPPQSVSTVACGNCAVDTMEVSTDEKGTVGNTIVIVNRSTSENMVNTVHSFNAGNIAVTTVFAGNESPNTTALSSVLNMFEAKNCGNGCLTSNMYEFGTTHMASFKSTDKPTEDQMGIEPMSDIVVNIVAGETSASIIKVDKVIVGYMFHLSGERQSVGITEGSVTLITCNDDCVIQGTDIAAGETVGLFYYLNDFTTPNDHNWTAVVSGTNMDVTILTTEDFQALLPESYLEMSMDGKTKEVNN